MCTLSERLKRNNYQLKIDADFLGGGGPGEVAREWGSKWGSEYKFRLKMANRWAMFLFKFPTTTCFLE